MNRLAAFYRSYGAIPFFLPFGLILIVFGFMMFRSADITKDYLKTEAVVTRTELFEEEHYDGDTHHDATYTVFVKYTVDGQEYEEEFGIFSGYKEGEKVQIVYNPANPREISSPGSFVIPVIMMAAGVLVLVITVLYTIRTAKKNAALKSQEKEWIS